MNTELSPDSETRNNNHHDSISIKRQSSEGEESSADSTSFVVATPGIERVESARIESLEEQHRKPTVYNETGHIRQVIILVNISHLETVLDTFQLQMTF